jgi:hypothetical protein
MTKETDLKKICKNCKKEDCPDCKDLPEGVVAVGHDHRQPKKPLTKAK